MDWGLILLLLICPIMMMFMMKGHNHGGDKHGKSVNSHQGHKHDHSNTSNQVTTEVGRLDEYKVKRIEGELEFLKSQNEQLQQKIADMA